MGLAVSLVWAVVVVVEEMLCANSKVRLLAHDDLTWNNNLSYAIPHDRGLVSPPHVLISADQQGHFSDQR